MFRSLCRNSNAGDRFSTRAREQGYAFERKKTEKNIYVEVDRSSFLSFSNENEQLHGLDSSAVPGRVPFTSVTLVEQLWNFDQPVRTYTRGLLVDPARNSREIPTRNMFTVVNAVLKKIPVKFRSFHTRDSPDSSPTKSQQLRALSSVHSPLKPTSQSRDHERQLASGVSEISIPGAWRMSRDARPTPKVIVSCRESSG